ncbi:MAG: YbaN family protein [Aestuariivirga sp.]|uniref:YbaN family protein n=1 Tax=Aestuariivirga sp. TaxID=2650926 RepID=UPI0038D06A4B
MDAPNRHEAEGLRKPEASGVLFALRRPLLLGTGWLCVGLGVVGIVMPLFPTTPFLLVALWAFSKSSPELAERIRQHRLAGPYVRDWEEDGVIPPGAKILAVTMMAAMLGYLHFGSGAPGWVVIAAGLVVAAVAVYILSRPNSRRS